MANDEVDALVQAPCTARRQPVRPAKSALCQEPEENNGRHLFGNQKECHQLHMLLQVPYYRKKRIEEDS